MCEIWKLRALAFHEADVGEPCKAKGKERAKHVAAYMTLARVDLRTLIQAGGPLYEWPCPNCGAYVSSLTVPPRIDRPSDSMFGSKRARKWWGL